MSSDAGPLSLDRVTVSFRDTGTSMLTESSVAFRYGLNYITARNGAGKSTLLRALVGDDDLFTGGEVSFEGAPLRSDSVGLVTQDPTASICRDLTFRDNMLLAQIRGPEWLSLNRMSRPARWHPIKDRLDKLGMVSSVERLWERPALRLSGGEKQLLAILMRLGRGKRVLLLDECTASLDRANTEKVMSVLARLHEIRCVAVLVTHDLELIDEYEGPVFTIRDGKLKSQTAQPKSAGSPDQGATG